MRGKTFRLLVDDQEAQDFHRALAEEARRLAPLTAAALGESLSVDINEAKGSPETQRKQMARLGSTLALDSEDLIGLLPVDSHDIFDFQYPVFSPATGATAARAPGATRDKVVCAVFHQIIPPSLFDRPETQGRRLFSVAADQVEMGRLQAEQVVRLLARRPRGDRCILYVTGPRHSCATELRMAGANEVLSSNDVTVHLRHAQWVGTDVPDAMEAWLALGGQLAYVHAAAAHNDRMAAALKDLLIQHGRPDVPVVGMDGTDFLGKGLVENKRLAATVIQPLGVQEALRLYEEFVLRGLRPQDLPPNRNIRLAPASYPPVEEL